jgi:hypothetical protein
MNALAHTQMLQVLSQVQGLAVRTKWSLRTSVPFSSDVRELNESSLNYFIGALVLAAKDILKNAFSTCEKECGMIYR